MTLFIIFVLFNLLFLIITDIYVLILYSCLSVLEESSINCLLVNRSNPLFCNSGFLCILVRRRFGIGFVNGVFITEILVSCSIEKLLLVFYRLSMSFCIFCTISLFLSSKLFFNSHDVIFIKIVTLSLYSIIQ